MNKKLLIAIVSSVVSYAIFLYIIFVIYPNVGHVVLPTLLMMHFMSLFMMYLAYKGKTFRIPIIGNYAARISKIDDDDEEDET